MKYLISLLTCLSLVSIEAGEISRQEYLDLIKQHPQLVQPQGDFSKGEIQIVLDPQEMAAIEKATGRDVGLIKKDCYWLWINDACIFPNGHKGVYGRILSASLALRAGVAVMPVMPDGRIAVNCNFRHATRSWDIELPRGGVNTGESSEAAAKREVLEETGMIVDSLSLLGEFPPDSGFTGTVVPIFMANVVEQQQSQQEDGEAIEEILFLSPLEIKQAFLQGYLVHNVREAPTKVHFRDPFLAYAFLLYELKQQPNVLPR